MAGVAAGVNATIFAYGQTGTGKTHTMLGDSKHLGVALFAAKQLLADSSNLKTELSVSYLQIYGKHVTDLLDDSKEVRNLDIRKNAVGDVEVEGLSRQVVTTLADVTRLISAGSGRRAVTSTQLNSTSSRSHAVLTFWATTWLEADGQACVAKCNIVDLAGSERVKDSAVSGQDLVEARQINLSLFHLIRVVQALVDKKPFVPYSDDRLCYLLQDALGGNCRTTVIATISPAYLHANESVSTLKFAAACSCVKNRAKVNKVPKERARAWHKSSEPKKKPIEEKPKLPWSSVKLGGERCPGGRTSIKSTVGELSCLTFGTPGNPLVVCLHGHPSSAENAFGNWLLPALVHSGFHVVAIDMPGRGESSGKVFKTRSEFNLIENGPADVVLSVISALKAPKAIIVGYDWGAGIAISMAHDKKCQKKVNRIVVFHPAYNESVKDELKRVSCPCLILWCKQDQFHSWTSWKSNAKKLATSLGGGKYKEVIVSENNWEKYGWGRHAERFEREIVTFLTGKDPIGKVGKLYAASERKDKSTEGKAVVRRDNIVLESEAKDLDSSTFEAPDPTQAALKEFKAAFASGKLADLYRSSSQIFGYLPELSPAKLQSPDILVNLGLWEREPSGWNAMRCSKRYPPGRRVLVRARVNPNPDDRGFMRLFDKPTSQDPAYTTHWATLVKATGDDVIVNVETELAGSKDMVVSKEEIVKMNHSQKLPFSGKYLILEDGVRCNYSSPTARAKMCEIALKLAPLVSQMDFNSDGSSCEDTQRQCVRVIRGCLDLITFQRNEKGELNQAGDRTRDCSRYCKDSAALFAVNGQGHCHTVSSVMAAFLYPWCRVLGIDLKYRGGCSFYSSKATGPVYDSPESHQWLEFSTRPSCNSFVCDLYVSDGCARKADQQELLNLPITSAYQDVMYPNGRLLVLCGHAITTHDLEDSDF